MADSTQLALTDTATQTPIIRDQASLRHVRCSPAWDEHDDDLARRWLGPRIMEALPAAIEEAAALLVPASKELLVKGLASALTLVAGVGMGEAERKAWFSSAATTLREIPEDLFRRGIDAARRQADHPAKIIPAIMADVKDDLAKRRRDHHRAKYLLDLPNRPKFKTQIDAFDETTRCSAEDAARILAEVEQETGHSFRDEARQRIMPTGPRRKPTRQDYIDMGVDPAVLDGKASEAA